MSKAPKMPKIPPDDGIERHNSYFRLNPKGDKEFVNDDEETLNELAEYINECAEEIIWDYVKKHLSNEILKRPNIDDKIDDAIGKGMGPVEIVKMLEESITFSDIQTSGAANSSFDRNHNLLIGGRYDKIREAGEDINNLTSSANQIADGPERSRAKSRIKMSTYRGNAIRNKYISRDSDDLTHSESFVGTGDIAVLPDNFINHDDDDCDDDHDDNDISENRTNQKVYTENTMSRRNDALTEDIDQLLNEWEPTFKGDNYSPGEYQMPSPIGNGVADRKLKKEKIGSYDTKISNLGKEWPRKHKDTAAMCDVDEDGVEHKSQGGHESSHGDPSDGHQTEVGHNWPDGPKNDGSGVAEPFDGNRWSDGGTLKGGSGQNEIDNKGKTPKFSNGQITGTSGPQLGQPSESWNPNNIGMLMGEDVNLQSLFDNYARDYEIVCVEDFQALCNAHGCGVTLDEESLLRLMSENNEFIFYEGEDANGLYWSPTPIAENRMMSATDCDDEEDDEEGLYLSGPMEPIGKTNKKPRKLRESTTKRKNIISEVQVRSAEEETMPHSYMGQGKSRPMGDPDFSDDMMGDVTDNMGADSYDDMLGMNDEYDSMHGQGRFGDGCPECGAPNTGEENCPECGADMGLDSEEGVYGAGRDISSIGSIDDVDDYDEYEAGHYKPNLDPNGHEYDDELTWHNEEPALAGNSLDGDDGGLWEESINSPQIAESLHKFMKVAKRILENKQGFSNRHMGEALTYSWHHHANGINPNLVPTNVKRTLRSLASRFPSFMIENNEVMDSPDGTSLGTGGVNKSSKYLPDTDTEMHDEGEPLGAKQTNDLSGTPEIKGTAKGMDGKGSVPQAVKENIFRLSKHVQNALKESAKNLRSKGKYDVKFAVLVSEGRSKNRTPVRQRLAEALADAEEVLQLHNHNNVQLEAAFYSNGSMILKHDIPLMPIKKRGFITSEGKALFRFNRNAEAYANRLVSEGYTCRVTPHNWGRAVSKTRHR